MILSGCVAATCGVCDSRAHWHRGSQETAVQLEVIGRYAAEVSGHPPPAGIDRNGDAVVLWDEADESSSQGVFTATHHAEP